MTEMQAVKDAIRTGWNGLKWGATILEFHDTFPKAELNGSWLRTGLGPESFCGVPMAAQYGFNPKYQLYTVAFYPEPENRARASAAAIAHFGEPAGDGLLWTFGDVVVEVKIAGVIVAMTHTLFAQAR